MHEHLGAHVHLGGLICIYNEGLKGLKQLAGQHWSPERDRASCMQQSISGAIDCGEQTTGWKGTEMKIQKGSLVAEVSNKKYSPSTCDNRTCHADDHVTSEATPTAKMLC